MGAAVAELLARGLPARGEDAQNEQLLERANATGEIFLSHTRLHDRYWLRLAVGSARTTEDDVRRAWEVLRECAR